MSDTNIIQLFPNPLPPIPTGAALASWKITIAKAHPTTMPIVVPNWWTAWYTMDNALQRIPKPVDTVADVRQQFEKSRRRWGVVGMVAEQTGVAA